jgi:hypothetical protein
MRVPATTIVGGRPVIAAASLVLGLGMLIPASAEAQWVRGDLPEPRLVDTPWGDFPLSRLQAGARVRLTTRDGRRVEARVLAVGDSTLLLRTAGRDTLPAFTLAELRDYRSVEVRSVRAWHERAATVGLVGGAILGGALGAATYGDGGAGKQGSRGEEIAYRASLGGFLGWAVGFYGIGRPRWRPVALPPDSDSAGLPPEDAATR